MTRSSLAKKLVTATNKAEISRLLSAHQSLADEGLAAELRRICYEAWTSKPTEAQKAARAAGVLARRSDSPDILATSLWLNGISNITLGKFEGAADNLSSAAEMLDAAGRNNDGAQARVALLMALAMSGRYDQAVKAGEQALKHLDAARDDLGAGKVAMNLSNVVSRQGRHREAERYGLAARKYFARAGEATWLAMAENGLANTYAELNEFAKARRSYETALATARASKMTVTEAEIEASLGNLAVLRGQYAEAVRYLERSRQRYSDLEMPHQSAVADLEIADIYSELNLLAEAAEIYRRVAPEFARLKLRAEEARSRLHYGRTLTSLGDTRGAKAELQRALRLFISEKNFSGQVAALAALADVAIHQKRFHDARSSIADAQKHLSRDEDPRDEILIGLLEGRTLVGLGASERATKVLAKAERRATKRQQLDVRQSIRNELGKVAELAGDRRGARRCFERAINDIESLRETVGTDEFSVAFLGARTEPFDNLTRLLIEDGKFTAAFRTVERARSRALLDAIDASGQARVPVAMQRQLDEARSRLNFLYRSLDRGDAEDAATQREDIVAAETTVADVIRRINSLTAARHGGKGQFDLQELHRRLGSERTLIEYSVLDGVISAFVVGGNKVRYVSGLGPTEEVRALVDELHFHFETMRYGGQRIGRFAGQLKARADGVLARLYDVLIRPLEGHLTASKLVVVPAGVVHYVPLHALHDGERYLIEKFETVYSPAASVWAKLQSRRPRQPRTSLVMGFADERIPQAEREAGELGRTLPNCEIFKGRKATFGAFTANANRHDLIHLACHGQFRPDNPMFSSLHLADGWVTVQDICSRRLKASLVTLSACETGISKIAAGDELLGLVRGFLTAGALSLVVSLWTVNDAAARELMLHFYKNLQRGLGASASLRDAQMASVTRGEHPFLWSPFISIGR